MWSAIASKLCSNDAFVIPLAFKNYGWWPELPLLLKKDNLTKNSEKCWKEPITFRFQENDTFVITFQNYGW